MSSELEQRQSQDFYRDTLSLAITLARLVENHEEPYEDPSIRAIIQGDENFRNYHPVMLFSAIQLIDELAQFIKPKRVAEMEPGQAWSWEMERVLTLMFNNSWGTRVNSSPLIVQMGQRLLTIIKQERRQYEQ